MATKEAKRAKAHKLLKNTDPTINLMDYTASMSRATNYLNVTYDAKERKVWIKSHFPKIKFGDHSDYEFRTLSTLCRLVDNGNELSDEHMAKMASEVERLSKPKVGPVEVQEVTTSAPKFSIQDKMDDKVSEFLAEFSGLVDGYLTDRTIPKVDSLVNTMGIRGPMVKKVLARVDRTVDELRTAVEGEDKYLSEAYSNFKKVELKRLLGIYESLITALGQAKVMTVRKTRAVKVKPPAVVAAKVKYQPENLDLHIKSVTPASVVGASELWVFNTKYRTLQYYEASSGASLTFKGTTLLNFDVEKSFGKTIRKTEVLQSLVGKRMYAKFLKETKATNKKVTGRINEECLLLAKF
jgi:hypothetical protein